MADAPGSCFENTVERLEATPSREGRRGRTEVPGGCPGLLPLWDRDGWSVVEYEGEFHVDAEMLDRSVFGQYDLLF
jgi:hypothetical protein